MRLFLLRHAKSDQAAGKHMDDFDRPLNARGRSAAPRMGDHMKSKNYVPQLILCSSAARTQETLDLIKPSLSPAPKIKTAKALYLADWTAILKLVREVPRNTDSALVIGHNPGLERLAVALALNPANAAERARAERMVAKFPTAALAVFDFDAVDWASIKPGTGRLVDFVRPKDLEKGSSE
jgi:phosphohistidine phosphatase